MHWNCVSFLKIYLFIYLLIAPTYFGYSLAIIRVLVIWYSGRTVCIVHGYSSPLFVAYCARYE